MAEIVVTDAAMVQVRSSTRYVVSMGKGHGRGSSIGNDMGTCGSGQESGNYQCLR